MNAPLYDDLKIPPHDIDAEQSVLGGLLIAGRANDSSAWEAVARLPLTETDFYRQDHRLIFRAIATLAADNKPVDILVLKDWLESHKELENAGGFAYLVILVKETPSAANIKAYAEIVREKSLRRALLAFSAEMGDSVHANPTVSSNDLIKAAEARLFRLAESMRTKQSPVTTIKQGLKSVTALMDELLNKGSDDHLLGVTTGFGDLDEILSGLCAGDLVILAGRPSMGKTSLAGDFELAAATAGKPVLIFSLEMPTTQLVMRHLARQSGVSLKRIRKAWQMDDVDWARVGTAVKPLANLPIYMVNQPGISPSEVAAIARRVHRECLEKHGQGLGLITLDYLQLMQSDLGQGENRTTEVGSFSRSLKTLALELSLPIVALSQLNRNLETRPNKRPVMSDLRDSGAVEQDADVILFVYRDEVYKPDSPDKGTAEILIAKQRNGELGMVRLAFQGECTRFRNYSPDVYAGYR